MDMYKGIASRVRDFREARGWSQDRLALEAGLSKDGVSRIERGYRSPRLDTLEAIAGALGLPLMALINAEGPVPKVPTVHAQALSLQRLLDQMDPKLAGLLVALIRYIARVTRSR